VFRRRTSPQAQGFDPTKVQPETADLDLSEIQDEDGTIIPEQIDIDAVRVPRHIRVVYGPN
jgi:hypothetical protein